MFSKDIGIDLGTANTLVYIKGKGIVLREPSVVAVDIKKDSVLAVGTAAKEMLGRTPDSVRVIRPLKDGVIADFEITAVMLSYFIHKVVRRHFFFRPRIVICIPGGVTQVERRAVRDAADRAGAGEVELIDEPMAAALGAGLPVLEPVGSMVLDIGGGTSEVAVISLGDTAAYNSVRVAGDKFDRAIISYIKKKFGLSIGERTAENIKIAIGSAFPHNDEGSMTVKGRSTSDGMPGEITITAEEVRNALAQPLCTIIDGVLDALEHTPPEHSADIAEKGLTLTGGGALLKGIDELISKKTGIPVRIAERPLDCVADGAGKRLEMFRKNYAKSAVF